MRVAFVVQRYGEGVAGGAEALCRATARALAARGDEVEIYTTTARDYLTWAPHFAPGTERDGDVVVHRFPAEPPDPSRSAALVRRLSLAGGGDAAEERAWALAQGPVAPGMLRALAGARARHEALALWTYLYATSQLALPLARERSVLVPLAHDEPMLRFALSRGLVRMAAGLAFMTPEERRLVDDLHGIRGRPEAIVGAGLDPAPAGDGARARARLAALPPRFALYVGRVDAAKGLDALVRAHARYRAAGGSLALVLAGRPAGQLALPAWVRTTGFVDEATRADLLDAAEVVVVPSANESLSLLALEAWGAGRPTLATARSDVLAGQTARSGGGLLYTDDLTYARQLSRLAADPRLREALGGMGRRWVAGQTWDACARRWRGLLARVRRPLAAR
ncbi:glycosyltransferase family 4 protein [Miltoncostaea marina]|uniref:glycosyltransferase family 4 protein n=1 Tax=Miltoncostaea marina TaxID=2843215 RepID=UPI001C3C9B9A|nr:glycosyltransferase family 4 protein [Miltoncostaea marina]